MKKIVIMGAGGMATNTIDLIRHEQNQFKVVGILDPVEKIPIMEVPIIGNDDLLGSLKKENINHIFPAVGFGNAINNSLRVKLYHKILDAGYQIPNLISSKAFVRSNVSMGVGNIIQAGSIVDTNVKLNNNINIGFNVVLGHGAEIGNHVTITGSVNINGGVKIGEGSFLGMSCSVYKDVGKWCKVSPSIAVMEQLEDNRILFGEVCRSIPNFQQKEL